MLCFFILVLCECVQDAGRVPDAAEYVGDVR